VHCILKTICLLQKVRHNVIQSERFGNSIVCSDKFRISCQNV